MGAAPKRGVGRTCGNRPAHLDDHEWSVIDMDQSTDPVNPFSIGRGELIARCRAMAVKAKRMHGELTYRCPTCRDLGWVFESGTTHGGVRDVEVARRCNGPTASGCPFVRFEDERRPKPQATSRGRMD